MAGVRASGEGTLEVVLLAWGVIHSGGSPSEAGPSGEVPPAGLGFHIGGCPVVAGSWEGVRLASVEELHREWAASVGELRLGWAASGPPGKR